MDWRNKEPIYYYDIKQGTKKWYSIKKNKFTASHANTIIANGKGLETLVKELLADYYSSQEFDEYTDKYKNSAMQRGNDYEDVARMVYEFETGNTVKQIGFVERHKYIGCSPDGIIGDDGLLEIKNHNDKVFFELVNSGKIDSKYINQMQFQMFVTGRKWCDYFGFNPNYEPNYYIERIYPNYEKFERFEIALERGIELIETGIENIEKKLKKL